MLIFSPLGNGGLQVAGARKTVAVFPPKAVSGDALTLLALPEENPAKGVISCPGEYDIAGIAIRGVGQNEGQHVSYVVDAEGVRCAFPASPLQDWTEEDIAHLGDIHILCLPGDADPKLCQKLLDEIDPRMLMLVPVKDGIHEELLKVCGAVGKETMSEFKLKGTSFAAEGREVVVFS